MKFNRKIRAFTLSELVVVLVITAIVAGMAFAILRMVQKHMASINSNYDKITEFHKLEQALWLDFHRADSITFDEGYKVLQLDSITYSFETSYIIREVDTFALGAKNVSIFFNGEQVKLKNEKIPIDALKISTDSLSGSRFLFVFKDNAATDFMN